MFHQWAAVIAVVTVLVSAGQAADLALAQVFGDHAVLQRDMPIPVWGSAPSGATVLVTLAGKSASAKADNNGVWRVTLPALPAGGPYTMAASSGASETVIKDAQRSIPVVR